MSSSNPYVNRVLGSETFSYSKSYSRDFVYSDGTSPKPTRITAANSDFGFAGAVQALRMKYRNKVNYGGSYAVIRTSGFKSEKAANDTRFGTPREHEFVAILPLHVFLSFFANPVELADILMSKVEKLMAVWQKINGDPGKAGKRRPNTLSYDLDTHVWKGGKTSKEERSTYVLTFSTFNYTIQNQNSHRPKITPADVKVFIKLKSSTINNGPEANADLDQSYDGYGYQCSVPHLLGLLRKPEFVQYLSEVRKEEERHANGRQDQNDPEAVFGDDEPPAKSSRVSFSDDDDNGGGGEADQLEQAALAGQHN